MAARERRFSAVRHDGTAIYHFPDEGPIGAVFGTLAEAGVTFEERKR